MPAEPERFAALFNKPSVEAMHALSPKEFERFIAYVLRRAGYKVDEVGLHFLRGVDLEMRIPGKPGIFGGVECKRFAPNQLVTASVVRGAMGAPAVGKAGTRPFVITTSDFNEAAHQMAEVGPRHAHLVSGSQLIRYITYIKGSRYDDDDTITSLSPEYFAGHDQAQIVEPTKILTVANNKGGVGKTTTAYYLGAELARKGNRVLLIDLDGQANLTEWCLNGLAAEPSDDTERSLNITQYFSGQRHLDELIVPTAKDRLSLVPSDPFLTLRDLGGSGRPDVETRFVRDVRALCTRPIASLGGPPDWIIIDTPPAMSVFTRAGLAAAHYVLAPLRPRGASLRGTTNMVTKLETMNALTNGSTRFLGIVITHWDTLVSSRRFEEVDLRRALPGSGGQVLATKIPIDNQLERLEPGANTTGARAYADLAEEVVQNVNARERSAVEVRG